MATAKVGKSRNEPNPEPEVAIPKDSVRMALFIAEYPKDLNATKAAERAGYKWPDKIGPRLLKHPAVKAAIGSKVEAEMDLLDISVDRTLNGVAKCAFYDVGNLFEDDGSVKQIKDIDPATRFAIAGFEVVELFEGQGEQKHAYGLLKKIKLVDRGSALDKLMRYHSLYKDKVEVSIDSKLAETLSLARKRVASIAS